MIRISNPPSFDGGPISTVFQSDHHSALDVTLHLGTAFVHRQPKQGAILHVNLHSHQGSKGRGFRVLCENSCCSGGL